MPTRDAADLRQTLRGVVVPVVTPFDDGGGLDEPAFARHVDWLVEQGVHGILVADLVGEAWALTLEEKATLFRAAARAVGGRVPVVAKLSEAALRSQATLAEAARDAGVDAVKAALPGWPRAADDEVHVYLASAVGASGLPFMIETNGWDVSTPVLDRLVTDPLFAGLEEASLDLDRFALLVERYGERGPVFCGSEDVLAHHLALGGAGLMTAAPNFAPALMLGIWEAAVDGRHADVLERCSRLRRYRRLLAAELRAGRPAFASYAKAGLDLIGRPVGSPRTPLRSLTGAEREALAAVLFDPGGLTLLPGA
ncbi:MAG: dihydrodipicolinate synthase family protein [Chloroflexota bacterium]